MIVYALSIIKETLDANEYSKFLEILSHEDADNWLITIEEEIEFFHKNQTWELVEALKGKKVVGCKYVFKKKEGPLSVEDARYKI